MEPATLPVFEDCSFFTHYPEEIVSTFFEQENNNLKVRMYSDQLETRPMLIEMIHEIAHFYNYSVQTVHLGVHILDVYMDKYILSPLEDHQKLTGLICLILAAKSEDLDDSVPSIKDFLHVVNLTDDLGVDFNFKDDISPLRLKEAYKKFSRMYAQLEFLVFESLEFNLQRPTAATFIEVFRSAIVTATDVADVKCGEEEEQRTLECMQGAANDYVKQFLDLIISINDFANILPSKLTAAIIGATRKLLKIKNYWNDQLSDLLKQSVDDIRPLLIELIGMRMSIAYGLQSQSPDTADVDMIESGYISEPSFSSSDDDPKSPAEKKRRLDDQRPEIVY